MFLRSLLLISLILWSNTSLGLEPTATYKNHFFGIETMLPRFPFELKEGKVYRIAEFFGTPREGHKPHVSIDILMTNQKEFLAKIKKSIQDKKLIVRSQKSGKSGAFPSVTWIFEAPEDPKEVTYAKAIFLKSKVYLMRGKTIKRFEQDVKADFIRSLATFDIHPDFKEK